MRYLLDTNACIALLNDTSPPLRERLHRLAPADVGLPAPVAYELYYGAYKSPHADRNLGLLDRLGVRDPAVRCRGCARSRRSAQRARSGGPSDRPVRPVDRGAGPRPKPGSGDSQQPGIRTRPEARLRRLDAFRRRPRARPSPPMSTYPVRLASSRAAGHRRHAARAGANGE